VKLVRSRATAHAQEAASPPAPELAGVSMWLNSDAPVSLYRLYGEIIMIEFWTFGCINCVRTLPFMAKMDRRYRRRGLVVLGIHTPEFPHETRAYAGREALADHGLRYKVGLDNSYASWNAYGVEFWPTVFVVNRQGAIAHRHIGEGGYGQTERVIKRLLAEPAPPAFDAAASSDPAPWAA
jgi:thiol-disulfide isomerase/thioredoxin